MTYIVPCACVFVVAGFVMIGFGVSGFLDDPSLVQIGGPIMMLLIGGCVIVLMCGGAALMDLCRILSTRRRRIPSDPFDRVVTSDPVEPTKSAVHDFL